MLELIEVNKNNIDHINDLYFLLKNKRFNISHQNLPSLDSHIKFIKDSKYRKWYLVKKTQTTLGSCYITYDNVIGINLLSNACEDYINLIEMVLKKNKPLPLIESFRSKYFLINVNPNNSNLIKAVKSLGMDHIQNTYAYKNNS